MSTKTTKSGTIFKLVSRQSGATLAQLVKATGWKAPSVHAGLTGLRKQGREITRDKKGKGVTVYRIADGEAK
jgi:hypothetical protein